MENRVKVVFLFLVFYWKSVFMQSEQDITGCLSEVHCTLSLCDVWHSHCENKNIFALLQLYGSFSSFTTMSSQCCIIIAKKASGKSPRIPILCIRLMVIDLFSNKSSIYESKDNRFTARSQKFPMTLVLNCQKP